MSLLLRFAHTNLLGPPQSTMGARPVAVPLDDTEGPAGPSAEQAAVAARLGRRIGRTLLATVDVADSDLALLEADLDEDVEVVAPSLSLRSRFELLSALVDDDDTIGNIEVVFTEVAVTATTVLLEWSAIGRFTGPALLNDDELVEPTGAQVCVDGALSLTLSDAGRVTRIHCYYDRLALIEQLVRTGR